jgi:DNA polymerase III subunit delta'
VSNLPASRALPGIEDHPHAQSVLGAALAGLPGKAPSHAYLLHGPAGAGKRALTRAFAGELLAAGPSDQGPLAPGSADTRPAAPRIVDRETARAARERAGRGTHPDLTWVAPSGAAEMLVGDIDQAVVAAAALTPFESARRVFVIEGPERLNEQAANKLLKTLEEPPAYVHLLLVSDRPQEVLPTIASRCVHVRFDAPSSERIAQRLLAEGVCAEEPRARACARLALGDAARARALAGPEGETLRAAAEAYARAGLAGEASEAGLKSLLDAAKSAGAGAGEEVAQRLTDDLELAPAKERKRLEREALEAGRRAERRARALALDGALRLAELWLRDVVCVQEGAPELIHALDCRPQLQQDADRLDRAAARAAVARVRETRSRLQINVAEELALEALAHRLAPAA